MNGRCETDPLDRAVDVCDSCYGEFCQTCLVSPKGRRHPVCRDCALVQSGVRGAASATVRGERRTVKQRRAEIQAAAAEEETRKFRFFDEQAYQAGAEPVAEPARRKRPKRGRTGAADPDGGQSHGSSTPGGGGPSSAEPAGTTTEPDAAAAAPSFDPLPSTTKPATPAVARLEELRRRGGVNRPTEAVPGPDDLPADHRAGVEADDDDADSVHPRSAELAAQLRTTYSTPVETRRAGPERRKPGRPAANARPDRRTVADRRDPAPEPPAEVPPTAPMIGEVRVIGDRREADQTRRRPAGGAGPEPTPAGPSGPGAQATTAVASEPALIPPAGAPRHFSPLEAAAGPEVLDTLAEQLQALEPAVAREADGAGDAPATPRPGEPAGPTRGRVDTPGRADTDAEGNWIPPILRGIADDARQASTSLPQRRRPPGG